MLGTDGNGRISIINDGFVRLANGRIHYRVFQVTETDDSSVCEVYFSIIRNVSC